MGGDPAKAPPHFGYLEGDAAEKMSVCLALLLLLLAGCNSYECNCPANGCFNCSASSSAETSIPILSDATTVSSATADAPCTATFQAAGDQVLVSRLGPGSCVVWVVSSSGTTEVSQVKFSAISGACGCYLGGSASPLEPVDASTHSQ
jgi:hypothetical protein